MDLVILPGNSKEYNEKWLYDSQNAYQTLFDKTSIQIFKHWQENTDFDLDFEVAALANAVKDSLDYIIFAKSIGVLVTLKAISDNKISPVKCIFVGSPFEEGVKKFASVEDLFTHEMPPILFIQQTDDMFFKYAQLEDFVKRNNITNCKMIEIPGSNHAYDNYSEIKEWLNNFVFNK